MQQPSVRQTSSSSMYNSRKFSGARQKKKKKKQKKTKKKKTTKTATKKKQPQQQTQLAWLHVAPACRSIQTIQPHTVVVVFVPLFLVMDPSLSWRRRPTRCDQGLLTKQGMQTHTTPQQNTNYRCWHRSYHSS